MGAKKVVGLKKTAAAKKTTGVENTPLAFIDVQDSDDDFEETPKSTKKRSCYFVSDLSKHAKNLEQEKLREQQKRSLQNSLRNVNSTMWVT